MPDASSARNSRSQLNLKSRAEEQIEEGQVYYVPLTDTVNVKLANQPQVFTIQQDDYEKRYQQKVKHLNLPDEQKHAEKGMVNFLIYNDLYKEEHDLFNKVKRRISKKFQGGSKGGNAQS